MNQETSIEMGSVQLHPKVIAEIVLTAMEGMKGAEVITSKASMRLFGFVGKEVLPGIKVKINSNQDVSIDLRIKVQYGLHIPDIAREIQTRIKKALGKTVEINLKKINVNVQGIERGQK